MAMLTFMLSRPRTRSVALGAAVLFAGDGFGSQSFVEKKFSDATDAWDRSDRTLESISRVFSESTSAAMVDRYLRGGRRVMYRAAQRVGGALS